MTPPNGSRVRKKYDPSVKQKTQNKQKYKMKNPTLKHADAIIHIMQGILASGHFTEISENEDGSPKPRAIRDDVGEDYFKHGFSRRFYPQVVYEAIYPQGVLMDELSANEHEARSTTPEDDE